MREAEFAVRKPVEFDCDYFHLSDPNNQVFHGQELPVSWWSRRYEYPWAFSFARPGHVCADMGCGYVWRPFMFALADRCARVYAVDGRNELLGMRKLFQPNLRPVIANLDDTGLQDGLLDRIYCISVLEEAGPLAPILREFRRLLAPRGRIVCTFDSVYDPAKPLGPYGALSPQRFWQVAEDEGLCADGPMMTGETDRVYNGEFNLCVYHAVLKRR